MIWKILSAVLGGCLALGVLYHTIKARRWQLAQRTADDMQRRRIADEEIRETEERCVNDLEEIGTEDREALRHRANDLRDRLRRRREDTDGG